MKTKQPCLLNRLCLAELFFLLLYFADNW